MSAASIGSSSGRQSSQRSAPSNSNRSALRRPSIEASVPIRIRRGGSIQRSTPEISSIASPGNFFRTSCVHLVLRCDCGRPHSWAISGFQAKIVRVGITFKSLRIHGHYIIVGPTDRCQYWAPPLWLCTWRYSTRPTNAELAAIADTPSEPRRVHARPKLGEAGLSRSLRLSVTLIDVDKLIQAQQHLAEIDPRLIAGLRRLAVAFRLTGDERRHALAFKVGGRAATGRSSRRRRSTPQVRCAHRRAWPT